MTTFADDYAEISNLVARYCVLLDLDDVDQWLELFVPDASYQVYGRTFVGHEGLRRMMAGAPGGLHLGGPPVVLQIDGDRARTQQNLLFIERTSGEMRKAVYDDELVRTEDGWRIGSRRCRFIVAAGLDDRPES
jgi:3-phenylpropionate/cinnamic acid dioxygenase small subunit